MEFSLHTLDRQELTEALECRDPEFNQALLDEAFKVKIQHRGAKVFLRGLIEISNICTKNCLYCGIRKDIRCPRYELTDEQVMDAARLAAKGNFGSIVIQGGERTDVAFISRITRLVRAIKAIDTGGKPLGITLSLGEQTREVYEEWFDAGAHRYLLRIESSNPDLYRKLHPQDGAHSFERRMRALLDLKETGYRTGTGAMIGFPGQTAADMADDLLFYKSFGAPMIGMGPYNPHPDTPLTRSNAVYPADDDRFMLGLKMIALLRLLMPDINIAAATALEVLNPHGREQGLLSGANVFMPNLTPAEERNKYNLYDRKTLAGDFSLGDSEREGKILIGYGEWGDY